MATQVSSKPHIPGLVGLLNPLAQRMLGIGIPLGPNALITVRGRKSGEPRTTPVALIEIDGKRWVSSPFGDVNWVRNLRAAGQATVTIGRRAELVTATELSAPEKVGFFRDLMGPFVRRIPLGLGRLMLGSVLGAKDIVDDPIGAAERHPVFELHAA
ncbi:MAG TPA: nitroreductase family deazaflavin-dependent oxidoreductase [Candidatus Dormibacteraeota bacterium]